MSTYGVATALFYTKTLGCALDRTARMLYPDDPPNDEKVRLYLSELLTDFVDGDIAVDDEDLIDRIDVIFDHIFTYLREDDVEILSVEVLDNFGNLRVSII